MKRISVILSFFIVVGCFSLLSPVFAQDVLDFSLYSAAAEAGDSVAQYYMGYGYENGVLGLQKNAENAEYWYLKAAENGDPDALDSLGTSYLIGNTLPQNLVKAREYLKKAADKGNPVSLFSIARFLEADGENIKCVASAKLGIKRLRPLSATLAGTLEKGEIYSANLSDDDLAKANALVKKMDAEIPLLVPKGMFNTFPLTKPYLNDENAKSLQKEVRSELKKKFPTLSNSLPSLVRVSRSKLFNLLKKDVPVLDADPEEQYTKAQTLMLAIVLMRVGLFCSETKSVCLNNRAVEAFFKSVQITDDKIPSYLKLFYAGEAARGWLYGKLNTIALYGTRPADDKDWINATLIEGLVLHVQCRLCQKYGCDKSLLTEGLFHGNARLLQAGHTIPSLNFFESTGRTGLRFFNYISATYGPEAIFQVFNNLPSKSSFLEKPETYSFPFGDESPKELPEVLLKKGIKNFKGGNFSKAKIALRLLFQQKPLDGMGRFLMAVMAAKEKDFGAAWLNSSIARRQNSKSEKIKKFIAKLQKAAPKEKLLW